MKRVWKKLTLLAIVMAMLVPLAPVRASAANYEQDTKRWNIMVVMDSSGSLDASGDKTRENDPQGLRFEAIASFLAVLQDNGHNIGAITYGEKNSNFGMYSLDDNKPAKVKNDLCSYISDWKNRSIQETRTYGALLEAAETLMRDGDPNLESAIFLFTDGESNSETKAVKEAAISKIRDAGIKMCGVYLNSQGELAGQQQVKDIVRQANSRTESDSLADCFLAITDPTSCTDSIDLLMRMLGYDVGSHDVWSIPGTSKSFFVPGVGVEEASIRLNSVDGERLPEMIVEIACEGSDPVVFKDPLTAKDGEHLVYKENTVHVYKIKKPQSGTWTVTARTLNNEIVDIYYTPIFSYDIDAKMECTPASADLHMNMDVTVESWLSQKGNLLTDPGKYVGYSCYVSISDLATGELVKEIPVAADPNGRFVTTVKLQEDEGILYGVNSGEYRVSTRFQCGEDMKVISEAQVWNLKNQAPVLKNQNPMVEEVEYGLFRPATTEIDLSGRFEDREDGQDITLYIDGQGVNGVQLQGSRLTVTPKEMDGREVTLNILAKDKKDAVSDLSAPLVVEIETTDVTVRLIITIVVVALLVLLAILLIIVKINNDKSKWVPNGVLSVAIQGEGVNVNLTLTAPGVGTKRNTNLHALIGNAVSDAQDDSYSVAAMDCKKADVSPDVISELISADASELRKVQLSLKLVNSKSKNKKEAIPCITYMKKTKDLRNGSWPLNINDTDYDLSYYLMVEDDPYEEMEDIPTRRTSKKKEKKPAARRARKAVAPEEEDEEF